LKDAVTFVNGDDGNILDLNQEIENLYRGLDEDSKDQYNDKKIYLFCKQSKLNKNLIPQLLSKLVSL